MEGFNTMSHLQGPSVHPDLADARLRTEGRMTSRGEVASPGRSRALAVTQFAAFLLDVSIVNVALPSIERNLAVYALR